MSTGGPYTELFGWKPDKGVRVAIRGDRVLVFLPEDNLNGMQPSPRASPTATIFKISTYPRLVTEHPNNYTVSPLLAKSSLQVGRDRIAIICFLDLREANALTSLREKTNKLFVLFLVQKKRNKAARRHVLTIKAFST